MYYPPEQFLSSLFLLFARAISFSSTAPRVRSQVSIDTAFLESPVTHQSAQHLSSASSCSRFSHRRPIAGNCRTFSLKRKRTVRGGGGSVARGNDADYDEMMTMTVAVLLMMSRRMYTFLMYQPNHMTSNTNKRFIELCLYIPERIMLFRRCLCRKYISIRNIKSNSR